jgi:hypothetical protein
MQKGGRIGLGAETVHETDRNFPRDFDRAYFTSKLISFCFFPHFYSHPSTTQRDYRYLTFSYSVDLVRVLHGVGG